MFIKKFVLDFPGGTQGTTKCVLEFKILTPAGCPGGSYSSGKRPLVILFWVVLGFLFYFILGTVSNMKRNELSGKDAIPNIEFWRELPVFVQVNSVLPLGWYSSQLKWH